MGACEKALIIRVYKGQFVLSRWHTPSILLFGDWHERWVATGWANCDVLNEPDEKVRSHENIISPFF